MSLHLNGSFFLGKEKTNFAVCVPEVKIVAAYRWRGTIDVRRRIPYRVNHKGKNRFHIPLTVSFSLDCLIPYIPKLFVFSVPFGIPCIDNIEIPLICSSHSKHIYIQIHVRNKKPLNVNRRVCHLHFYFN